MRRILWVSCFCLALWTPTMNAEVTPYLLEISSGLAHTSGGFGGGGYGDVTISGRFWLHVDAETNGVALEDVDISLSPLCGFDWNWLEGTLDRNEISLLSWNPLVGMHHGLAGSFDGSAALLSGTIYEGCYDGYQYDCYLTAAVAPGPGPLGDANLDGVVDDDDLSLLLAGWTGVGGRGATWRTGDFDGNGAITDADLSLLLANWTGSAGATAIPEPASAALVLLGVPTLVRRRRRR